MTRRVASAAAILAAFRILAALAAGLPVAALAAGPVARLPGGDAAYFEPGAHVLVDASFVLRPALPRALSASAAALAGGLAASLVALALALAALGGALSAARAARALGRLGTLALLFGTSLLARVAALALALGLGRSLVHAAGFAGARAEIAVLAAGVLGLALGGGVSLAFDVSAAAAVDAGLDFHGAASRALRTLRRALPSAALAKLAAFAVGAAALALAGGAAERVEQAAGGYAGLALVLFALALGEAARATWLAFALELSRRAEPENP